VWCWLEGGKVPGPPMAPPHLKCSLPSATPFCLVLWLLFMPHPHLEEGELKVVLTFLKGWKKNPKKNNILWHAKMIMCP
jgi:hypothetical protein